jgi:hypothetical protein
MIRGANIGDWLVVRTCIPIRTGSGPKSGIHAVDADVELVEDGDSAAIGLCRVRKKGG